MISNAPDFDSLQNTMRFGVNTLIWNASFDSTHFPLLPRIKAAGFDGIEVPLFDPASFPAAAIRRELADAGLASTCVSIIPGGSSLIAEDQNARNKAISHVQTVLEKASELGAEILAGPLYSPVGFLTGARRTSSEWLRGVESWQRLVPAVRASGVQIAIEPLNRFETYFLNTAADGAEFCDAINDPQIGILFDTFHANIEEKSIGQALRSAARHLKHLHTCENDRGTPGTGNVNWPEFFQTVAAIGYNGWMTIESFGFSLGPVSAAAAIWRDLAPTPESIAFDGIGFLREHVTDAAHPQPGQ